ncbi:MAG: RNase adapter RapZ [Pseudomonadota bacterium]
MLQNILLITGVSGAGKTSFVKCLEDMGYFCIDNLPIPLFNKFLYLMDGISKKYKNIGIAIDVRSRDFFEENFEKLIKLKNKHSIKIVFLDASDELILRRFRESRRAHPLDSGSGTESAMKLERRLIDKLEEIADFKIDTSDLNVHTLQQYIYKTFNAQNEQSKSLNIILTSFGYKYGNFSLFDLIIDTRFLPNPFFIPELKMFTGRDQKIIDYFSNKKELTEFIEKTQIYFDYLFPNYQKEGKVYLNVGIGCTGGKHRSVYIVEMLKDIFSQKKLNVTAKHRDIDKE